MLSVKLLSIPDYYPQDGSSRHLFHPSGEICDCDCVADGFFGCLRRNKRCLCKIFVILLSSLMIAMLLFPVLSPDVIQTKSKRNL